MAVQGKPVEDPEKPYKPNRIQITTMVTPHVRAMLKQIKLEEDISYGQAICDAVEAYWTQYAEPAEDKE